MALTPIETVGSPKVSVVLVLERGVDRDLDVAGERAGDGAVVLRALRGRLEGGLIGARDDPDDVELGARDRPFLVDAVERDGGRDVEVVGGRAKRYPTAVLPENTAR